MKTAYISHPVCLEHDTGLGHPENSRRLTAINDRLIASHLYDFLKHVDAPEVSAEQLERVHPQSYIDKVLASVPTSGHAYLDPDTVISPKSFDAAKHAAGAVVQAVDMIMDKQVENAFCAVRPPGHHAESERAMGFCVFNNIAVGVAHALEHHGLEKVAVLDFDVHQGNGTEEIFYNDERVMFCSTFQHPFYPHTALHNTSHLINVPLEAGASGKLFRQAVNEYWLPALRQFKPEMIFVSAGFDAHAADDMSGLRFDDADYQWISALIVELAGKYSEGRIVSSLEGGYELHSLSRCVALHIKALMGVH